MAKVICGIYKFTNKINGKIYIGKSKDILYRYYSYSKPSMIKKCANTLLFRAFNKYGRDNFNFEIIFECPEDQLCYWEKYFIKLYNSNNPEVGYNMTEGGDGLCGHEPWNKGKKGVYSDETRKSMGAHAIGNTIRKGKHHSEESRKLISEHSKGKKLSEETCKKMSISRSGSGNPMYGKPGVNKGKHRVWNEDHTKYVYVKNVA